MIFEITSRGGGKLTGWGKNGPAYFFPGERMGRPILSPGEKLTGWKFRPVTPGRVAQSVTCLATDASLTADPGVASLIPAWSHTFVEIDHDIISTVILLPSAESFKKGCCQLQAKVHARGTG